MAKYEIGEDGDLRERYPDSIKDVPRISSTIRARLKTLPNAPSIFDDSLNDSDLDLALVTGLSHSVRLLA